MQLSTNNCERLYEDFGNVRNNMKMLYLINTTIYSVPISNGEEAKIINKGQGKNGKIVQLGSLDESASWPLIRNVVQDCKKWMLNPQVDEVEEDCILHVV